MKKYLSVNFLFIIFCFKIFSLDSRSNDIQRVNSNYLAHPIIKHQFLLGDANLKASNDLAINDLGKWELIGGKNTNNSWDYNYFEKTRALYVDSTGLYVGLLATERNASIWKFHEGVWKKIGGDKINQSWSNAKEVSKIHKYKGEIYAGVDNEIWKFSDSNKWKNITPKINLKSNISAMKSHKGKLYIGLNNMPYLIHFDGKKWDKENLKLDLRTISGIYSLHSHTDGNLYAGTVMKVGFSALVLKKEKNKWKVIGGPNIKDSWINTGFIAALSFTSYKDNLIVTFNRRPMAGGLFSSIWAFNGDNWKPVGASKAPTTWEYLENFNASIVFNSKLLVSGGGKPAGLASLWEYNIDKWEIVAGFGVSGSWGRAGTTLSDGESISEHVYNMVKFENKLYLGFGDGKKMSQIWRYTANR